MRFYLTCDPADGWLPDNGSPRLEMHFVENVPGNVFYRFVADTGWECIPATSLHSGVNRWIILPQLPPKMRSTCGSRGTCSATPSG